MSCMCKGCQRNNCRRGAHCKDRPRHKGRNKRKKQCTKRVRVSLQRTGEADPRSMADRDARLLRHRARWTAEEGRPDTTET